MNSIRFFVLFFFSITLSFSAETYSKQEIEKMIAKMVILGFDTPTATPNDEIYKNIKAGLGGVILFDKNPNDKTKIKNIKNKEQLRGLTSQLQSI